VCRLEYVTVYDSLDWHADAATRAGRPALSGFAHIGLYLAWLIRNDLHAPGCLRPERIAGVKSGALTGTNLVDDVDAKLVADLMSPEGRAFSDARYGAYIDAFQVAFAELPAYGAVDNAANYERMAPILDQLFSAWVADGRPINPREHAVDRKVAEAADWAALNVGSDLGVLRDLPPEEAAARLADAMSEVIGGEAQPSPSPGDIRER
jgi:hypothetical protein